jgi:hypothetical protein
MSSRLLHKRSRRAPPACARWGRGRASDGNRRQGYRFVRPREGIQRRCAKAPEKPCAHRKETTRSPRCGRERSRAARARRSARGRSRHNRAPMSSPRSRRRRATSRCRGWCAGARYRRRGAPPCLSAIRPPCESLHLKPRLRHRAGRSYRCRRARRRGPSRPPGDCPTWPGHCRRGTRRQ